MPFTLLVPRLLLALAFLMLSLPGANLDLAICLGSDGHLALKPTEGHCTTAGKAERSHCEEAAAPTHGPCVDLVLCARHADTLGPRTETGAPAVHLALPQLSPPHPLQADAIVQLLPQPVSSHWLDHRPSVVLLI